MQTEGGYRLVQLAHGAWSVRSLEVGETFHPVIGPVAEAEALYVRQLRLAERAAATAGEFVVWDVGLGAAANVLVFLRAAARQPGALRVVSFDRTLAALEFGLTQAQQLEYFCDFESLVRELLAHRRATRDGGGQRLTWEVHLGDFPTLLRQPQAADWPKPHAIMFDAFSPARNPEMWTLPLFTELFRALDPSRPCVLPTYSRSTLLRVTLLLAGFYVGAGQATGDKEETTIAANTAELVAAPLDRRWLQRARRSASAEPLREPIYRQRRLTEETWDRLLAHPQFR